MRELVNSKLGYWRSHHDDLFQKEVFPMKTKFFSLGNLNRLISSIFEHTGKVVNKADVLDVVSRVYEADTDIKKSENNFARSFEKRPPPNLTKVYQVLTNKC